MKIDSTKKSFSGSISACFIRRGVQMAYDWDGKRTRRLQMLRFMGALAVPALLFGSALGALQWIDTDRQAVRTAQFR
ncbi:hypothetical protein EBB04_24440 [Sinorhizobium meliloti]|nr:hypothetical protein EBB04_24440 [Sinorhizobium meliloti]